MVKKKPVPKIGDLETPLEKVKKFYKFWSNFQSWRDFTVEGEYNIEEASSRYEKRLDELEAREKDIRAELAKGESYVNEIDKYRRKVEELDEKLRVIKK